METLEFYDVKSKRKFKTDKYEIRKRDVKGKPRYFAVCKSPTGTYECWRVVVKNSLAKRSNFFLIVILFFSLSFYKIIITILYRNSFDYYRY